jgi:hypothetical protein
MLCIASSNNDLVPSDCKRSDCLHGEIIADEVEDIEPESFHQQDRVELHVIFVESKMKGSVQLQKGCENEDLRANAD